MSAPVWIVKVGETVPSLRARRGDFEDWFRAGLGMTDASAPMVRPYLDEALPDPASISGCVVTGSPNMVTAEQPWSVATELWMRKVAELGRPLLGVCYGHQLLARAFGGSVDWCPAGREIGSVEIEILPAAIEDALFQSPGTAPPRQVVGQTSHSQSVVALPPGARALARNDHDPHQAFAIGRCAWGVQFHPEFDADIIRGYLAERREDIAAEGIDVDARIRDARDSQDGAKLLARFRDICERAP